MSDSLTPISLGRKPASVELSIRPPELDEAQRARRAQLRVALVAMPMAAPDRPSLALGLLAALGRAHGFTVDTVHAHLEFVDMAGWHTTRTLFRESRHQFSEWLFSAEAFGDDAPAGADEMMDTFGDHISELASHLSSELERTVAPNEILGLRARLVPRYLDRVEAIVDWRSYDVVGFTSTFQQTVASIAMARRLKAIKPELVIVGGGANFEGSMGRELLRATPWFDHAVSGEGDEVFPAFLAALAASNDPGAIPGVLSRRGGAVVGEPSPQVADMDALPTPDFDEFFERSERLSFLEDTARRGTPLPFESSRGCWWGEKKHCTFCGLNGGTMKHRAKSPERVLAELSDLTRRYRSFDLRATDNIMDERYFDELLPVLIDNEADFDLFYEIKANLDRHRIELLAKSGVRSVQPGIESLSSNVLRLMDKGIKAATNVNMLRWATHHDMAVSWNMLYGFPGETDDDYAIQADLAERIVHLHPPLCMARVMLERFSPMFDDRDRFPVKFVEPEHGYSLVYPPSYDVGEIAYFFDYEFTDTLPEATYERMHKLIGSWQEGWRSDTRPSLELWRSPDVIQVEDRRDLSAPVDWTFEGDLRALYLACFDGPRSPRQIAQDLDGPIGADAIESALDAFCDRGLMMRDGNLFVALATPARPIPKRVID